MEALFLKLVNMSLTASWLVLVIIAVRLVFKQTPKWIFCLLWGLVAFRLIFPFSIESALSLIPSAEPLPQEIIYTARPEIQSGVPVIDNTVNPMLESSMTPSELSSANPTQVWSFILSQVWILGMVLMLLYTAVSYLMLKRKVSTAIPVEKGIKCSEYVDSPFVLGLIRPVIYLPFGMEKADIAYVLAHEKAHIRRKDHWWKPIGFLLLSIYWFNPLLWVAYILLCRDIEAACDEKVIRDMSRSERRAYSTALLNCSIHRRRIAACPLAFGETGVKDRVKSVMNYKKPAFWVVLGAVVICAVICICFLTNPAGMHLYEIDDSRDYSDLFSGVENITLIRDGEKSPVSDSGKMLGLLDSVKVRKTASNQSRNENREKDNQIHLKGNTYLNFNQDYSIVWIDNGIKPTYSYNVLQPAKVKEIFETYWQESSEKAAVYTWFDRDSENPEEYYPQESVLELSGMDGVSLSYRSENTEIRMIRSGSIETIISGDERIRNVFLADLNGDGVPEVCATVENASGRDVVVYDPAQEQRYTFLSDEDGFYTLTKKANCLCVLQYDTSWYMVQCGKLELSEMNGDTVLEIRELDADARSMAESVISVDVWTRKHTSLSSGVYLDEILSLLRDLENKVQPATREELEAAQENDFGIISIIINYELGEKIIYFSEDFTILWEYGASEGYWINDPEPIRQFVETVTNGVQVRETSGEPFATVDVPWEWCRNLSIDAVSSAEGYVCLNVISSGMSQSVRSTNGVLPMYTLENLVPILNQIPRDAFSMGEVVERVDYRSIYSAQQSGNGSVSIIDGVNHIAVILRYCEGKLEMLLTDEMEKVQRDDRTYLEATQMWEINSKTLAEFMQSFVESPLLIYYSVGAEYEWQEGMDFTSGDFSMNLHLIEGWDSEQVTASGNSGIRCRPEGAGEGWIYFSFWPDGYESQEKDRYFAEGSWMGFYNTIRSYPASVKSTNGVDTRHQIWSYYKVDTDIGDFVIINEGADSWFLEYEDQISDIISLVSFSIQS